MLKMLKYAFLILAAAALLAGCSGDDDEDSGTGPIAQSPPTAPNTTIQVPGSISSLPSSNQGRQLVESQIQAMTGLFEAYAGLLTQPSGAVASKVASPMSTWTWTHNWYGTSLVVTMVYEEDDISRKWTVTVGTFYVVMAEEWKDGSQFEFRYYTPEGHAANQPLLEHLYYLDGSNYFHFDIFTYDYSGVTVERVYEYTILVRTDGTGELRVESYDNLIYLIAWATTSGSWTYYDSSGNVISSGSW